MIETTHCITKKIAKRKLIFFDRTDDLNPFEIMLNIDVLKKRKINNRNEVFIKRNINCQNFFSKQVFDCLCCHGGGCRYCS